MLIGKEQGVALITVMLILALATILAVSMSSRQQLNIHRSSNIVNFEQAYQYILGAESWAQQILKRDDKGNDTDSFQDDWALPLPELPIEGGNMSGQIEDLQARFNLNNLVLNGKPQKLEVERFKRLLRVLELNEELSAVVVDWIDENENVTFSGAEDNDYLNLPSPYRTANTAMQDVSELLLLKGFDFDSYEKLRQYVCVLDAGSSININTVSAEVLSSLVTGLTLEDAKNFLSDRDKKTYARVEDFIQSPLFNNSNMKKEGLSVNSHYFSLSSSVKIDRINIAFNSVLFRENDESVMILRRRRDIL